MAFQPNLVVDNRDLNASKDAELLNSLTKVHAQFGMHQAALEFAFLANWLKPHDTVTLQLMAESLLQLQRAQDALDVLDEIEPSAVEEETATHLLAMRGNCLALLGQLDEARSVLSESHLSDEDGRLGHSESRI